MQVVYENMYYVVECEKESELPYTVRNKEYGSVEGEFDNLPQALIIAEQYYRLLKNDTWKQDVEHMYGPDTFGVVDGGKTH